MSPVPLKGPNTPCRYPSASRHEAFQSWKQIYNLSLVMTHVSFYLVAIRFYQVPESFTAGWPLLKHTVRQTEGVVKRFFGCVYVCVWGGFVRKCSHSESMTRGLSQIGILLMALHAWSSFEMFDVIREFGW